MRELQLGNILSRRRCRGGALRNSRRRRAPRRYPCCQASVSDKRRERAVYVYTPTAPHVPEIKAKHNEVIYDGEQSRRVDGSHRDREGREFWLVGDMMGLWWVLVEMCQILRREYHMSGKPSKWETEARETCRENKSQRAHVEAAHSDTQ